jgi:hypothetical protein
LDESNFHWTEKVLEILRSTELYLPSMTETKGRSEDPVTTDLLGALLMVSDEF